MIRALLTFLCLRRLRRRDPELFDPQAAAASVRACIQEEEGDG